MSPTRPAQHSFLPPTAEAGPFSAQCRQPSLSTSVLKPPGMRGCFAFGWIIAGRAGGASRATRARMLAFPWLVRVALADPAAAFALRAGGQHPRQRFFIFAFNFEFSSASTSASVRWLGVLDSEVAWYAGVLDPGCFECSATQAGGALSRQALRSLAFDID